MQATATSLTDLKLKRSTVSAPPPFPDVPEDMMRNMGLGNPARAKRRPLDSPTKPKSKKADTSVQSSIGVFDDVFLSVDAAPQVQHDRPASFQKSTAQDKVVTGTRKKAPKKVAAKNAEPLPLYSYTDFSPCPSVVYTRHEEEANDLVQALKGQVMVE